MNDTENIYKYVSRKTFFASLVMMSAFCLLCMLTIVFSLDSPRSHEQVDMTRTLAVSAAPTSFILRKVDGKLAVCDSIDATVLELLDIDLYALPQTERDALEIGICIDSVSELIAVICSYMS